MGLVYSNPRICLNPTRRDGFEPEVNLDQYTIRKGTVMLPGLSYVVTFQVHKSRNVAASLSHVTPPNRGDGPAR